MKKNKCTVTIPGRYIKVITEKNPTIYERGEKGHFAGRKIVYAPSSDMTRAMQLQHDIKRRGSCKPVLYSGMIVGRLQRYQDKPSSVKIKLKRCK